MSDRVLVLTPWMAPHRVVDWQTAVRMVYQKTAFVLAEYEEPIASPSVTWQKPAVLQLAKPVDMFLKGVRYSRSNVFARDGYRCVYCGTAFPPKKLTLDHLIPRAKGGTSHWNNIVTACRRCNAKKGKRTPAEAGLVLRVKPHRPAALPMRGPLLERSRVPEAWLPFLPALDDEGAAA